MKTKPVGFCFCNFILLKACKCLLPQATRLNLTHSVTLLHLKCASGGQKKKSSQLLHRLCAVFALVLRSVGLSPAESPVACTQITGRQTEGRHGCDQNMRWSGGDDFSSPAYRGERGEKSQQSQVPPSLQGRTTQGRHGLVPVLFRCCSRCKQSHNHHGQVHRSGSQGATGLTGASQKSSPSTPLGYFETQPTERGTRVEVGNRPWGRVRGFRQLRGVPKCR